MRLTRPVPSSRVLLPVARPARRHGRLRKIARSRHEQEPERCPSGANGVAPDVAQAAANASALGYPAPAAHVTLPLGGSTVGFWPYTGAGLDGSASDPVNLIFVGQADPVAIRNALLALDGERGGLPAGRAVQARWSDAMGDVQATYVDGEGWTGSVIQLQLGDYAPLRVHLRLFRVGAPLADGSSWTVGAAHFEVLIPGTADHQVLSWELAEQIVAADLARSGLLAAGSPSTADDQRCAVIPHHPGRDLQRAAAELVALIGGPAQPVANDVPIGTDGQVPVLTLAGRAPQRERARSASR